MPTEVFRKDVQPRRSIIVYQPSHSSGFHFRSKAQPCQDLVVLPYVAKALARSVLAADRLLPQSYPYLPFVTSATIESCLSGTIIPPPLINYLIVLAHSLINPLSTFLFCLRQVASIFELPFI